MTDYIKIIVAGDGGVGKTTFLNSLVTGEYSDYTLLTIGIELFVAEIEIEGKTIALQIWDLGGQERFKSLHEKCISYVVGARGGIIMFDLTRISSLDNIEFWVNIFRAEDEKIPILFVGSKSDLLDQDLIDNNHIMEINDEFGFCGYLEISSKIRYNIDKVLSTLGSEIVKR